MPRNSLNYASLLKATLGGELDIQTVGEPPAPEALDLFIKQCELTPPSKRSATEWNNLGYAHACLPTPQLRLAREAFTKALTARGPEEDKQRARDNLKVLEGHAPPPLAIDRPLLQPRPPPKGGARNE